MKKTFKYIISLALTISLCSCLFTAFATVESSAYLSAYSAGLTAESGKKIIINVDVDATDYMDEIGASSITLYRSSDGKSFSPIKTFDSDDYPDLLGSGLHLNEDVITYTGTAGYQYFAAVYCYAADSTVSDSRLYNTNVVTCFA